MEDIFIQSINVKKARNLVDFFIPLAEEERKHLIITGKNGSGKTSLLNEISNFLHGDLHEIRKYENYQLLQNAKIYLDKLLADIKRNEVEESIAKQNIRNLEVSLPQISSGVVMKFSRNDVTHKHSTGNFIIAYFQAKRNSTFKIPTGVNVVKLKPAYSIYQFAGEDFIQYIVNLKADRSFAKDDNDLNTANKIDEWFVEFEKQLFSLFDTSGVQLNFDRKTYNFNIVEEGKEPYNFNQLSGGFSAIMSIVSELILRMEEHRTKSYDVQGVVLIDEIETHLHIDLQKKILPFLTAFFPKIQFIVTTHSPFVLSSIDNAVICDLEKRIVTTDLSGYSYDTLIESYFNSDKYSYLLKDKIERYEELSEKNELNETEKDELFSIKKYVKEIPKFISDELAVKLQQIKLKELNKKVSA